MTTIYLFLLHCSLSLVAASGDLATSLWDGEGETGATLVPAGWRGGTSLGSDPIMVTEQSCN